MNLPPALHRRRLDTDAVVVLDEVLHWLKESNEPLSVPLERFARVESGDERTPGLSRNPALPVSSLW